MAAFLVFLISGMAATGSTGEGNGLPLPFEDLLSLSAAAADPDKREWHDDAPGRTLRIESVTIQRRVIIRVPMVPPTMPAPDGRPMFATPEGERQPLKVPGCIKLAAIRGAAISGKDGILFQTRSKGMFRGKLERGCRALDFQSGFYLNPPDDGSLCIGRDILHSRNGSACMLTRLTPAP